MATDNYDPRDADPDYPDLPKGWQWVSGNVSGGNYTRWFETEYRMGGPLAGVHGMGGYSGEVYWDRGGNGKHTVAIYAVTDASGDDPTYEDVPTMSREYDTAQAALDAVPKLIRNLKQDR